MNFSANYLSWSILGILLCLLTYTLWVIKNEDKTYRKHAKKQKLGPFILNVPHWWSLLDQNESSLIFHRRDTRYDWQAEFTLLETLPEDLKSFTVKYFQDKNIEFDEENFIAQSKLHFFTHQETQNQISEIIRIEGTATEKNEFRIYFDYALIKEKGRILMAMSKSSVLNGSVEGPYFEKVIKEIQLA